jgi:hypothetical protein
MKILSPKRNLLVTPGEMLLFQEVSSKIGYRAVSNGFVKMNKNARREISLFTRNKRDLLPTVSCKQTFLLMV